MNNFNLHLQAALITLVTFIIGALSGVAIWIQFEPDPPVDLGPRDYCPPADTIS